MDREPQLARDIRVQKLWEKLDTRQEGHLDLEGLKRGLKRIGHRTVTLMGCCRN